jgi:hypothetical protein
MEIVFGVGYKDGNSNNVLNALIGFESSKGKYIAI